RPARATVGRQDDRYDHISHPTEPQRIAEPLFAEPPRRGLSLVQMQREIPGERVALGPRDKLQQTAMIGAIRQEFHEVLKRQWAKMHPELAEPIRNGGAEHKTAAEGQALPSDPAALIIRDRHLPLHELLDPRRNLEIMRQQP